MKEWSEELYMAVTFSIAYVALILWFAVGLIYDLIKRKAK